jgi:hypothetical protein
MENITYTEQDDLILVSTDKHSFYIKSNNLGRLKFGLQLHFEHMKNLNDSSDEELAQIGKRRPKRSAIEEINYQIERKEFNGKVIVPTELLSRLPAKSQSRNRNGKQHIADSRWKNALKDKNYSVMALNDYYRKEAAFVQTFLDPSELYSLEKGSFKVSPCHIDPALTNRDEDSWSPDKICRDLSIMNKGFEKIKTSDLKGSHAITEEQANIAFKYLSKMNYEKMSATRKVMYYILIFRKRNKFYQKYDITDLGLRLY